MSDSLVPFEEKIDSCRENIIDWEMREGEDLTLTIAVYELYVCCRMFDTDSREDGTSWVEWRKSRSTFGDGLKEWSILSM
jgi:hypothetical protein